MHPNEKQKIQQAISILQQALGQKSGSGGVTKIIIPGFDAQFNNFIQLGQQLQPQIKELTRVFADAVGVMNNIMSYSSVCKAPSQNQKKSLQQKFLDLSKKTEAVEKNVNFVPHARAIRQLLSCTFWVFTNAPEMIFKGSIEAADFNALKFQRNKVQTHNDWYKSLLKSLKLIEEFVKSDYSMGLNYNSNGTNSWNEVISGGGSGPATQAPQQQTAVQAPVQAQQKPQAPKAPKKQLQGLNWLVANIKNQKITFAPGQVQMKHGLFIENCFDCTIQITDKFKSLSMNKSGGIVLTVNSCISGVQIINSDNIELIVKGQSPSISVDKCQKARIVLNEANMNCDIVTSKTTQINISYEKNGNQVKDVMIAEQLITKWNPTKNKFETTIYDKFM